MEQQLDPTVVLVSLQIRASGSSWFQSVFALRSELELSKDVKQEQLRFDSTLLPFGMVANASSGAAVTGS